MTPAPELATRREHNEHLAFMGLTKQERAEIAAEKALAADRRQRVVNAALEVLTGSMLDSSDLAHWNIFKLAFRPQLDATIDRLLPLHDGKSQDFAEHLLCSLILESCDRLTRTS